MQELVTRNTRHAIERSLERLQLSIGSLQEMLEAKAFVQLSPYKNEQGKSALVVYSHPDKAPLAVWLAQPGNFVLTAMPFSYQRDDFEMRYGVERVQNCLRRAQVLANGWLAQQGAPVAVPAAPETRPQYVSKVQVVLKTKWRKNFCVPLSASEAAQFDVGTMWDQRSTRRCLLALLEQVDFVRWMQGHLQAAQFDLDDLAHVGLQLHVNGTVYKTVLESTSSLACALADMDRSEYRQDPPMYEVDLWESTLRLAGVPACFGLAQDGD